MFIVDVNKFDSTGSTTSTVSTGYLTDWSPKDKPWDQHRAIADTVESLYKSARLDRYAERIADCGKRLEFALRCHDDGELGIKLHSAQFCRVRHCPVCQWRRAMKWQAKMFQSMPKINQAYPTHRWLFLTLTVRNCDITELRQTVVALNKGFERLTKRKNYPAIGWVRSIEVTRNPDTGKAHPHLHCLLLVKPSYFGVGYITAKQWQEMWQSCMRLDYLPVVNIKAVKPKLNKDTGICDDIGQAIVETLKYSVKESDLVADADWLAELTSQLHKTRAISIGGVLKEYLKDESDDDDLVNIDDEQDVSTGDEIDKLYFGWRETIKRYKRIEC